MLFRLAAVGGLVGFIASVLLVDRDLARLAAQLGGMPIVAWWPNLVIIFEMTMLSAILATVVSLLVTARLPSRAKSLYDPEVSDGKILVGVPIAADRTPEVDPPRARRGRSARREDRRLSELRGEHR